MTKFNNIKTIKTATSTVIKAIREGESLRIDYALQVMALTIAKHDKANLKAIDTAITAFTTDESSRTPKGEKQSRIHKDLKSFLGNCKKYYKTLDTIDTTDMTFNQLLTAVASLKEPKSAVLTKAAVETKAPAKSSKAKSPTVAPKETTVDVIDAVKHIKDEIIETAHALTSQSLKELESLVLENNALIIDGLHDLIEGHKGSKENLALIASLQSKLMDALQ